MGDDEDERAEPDRPRGLLPAEPHAGWFPLAALGFLLLGLTALGMPSGDSGWFAYTPAERHAYAVITPGLSQQGGNTAVPVLATGFTRQSEVGRFWPWVAGAGFLATLAWYAVRAHRTGRPFRPGMLVLSGLGGLVALTAAAVLGEFAHVAGPGVAAGVAWPVALLGLCGAGWAFFRLGPGARPAGITGVTLLALGAYALVSSVLPGENGLLIGAGLALLAWLERSVLLAAVAGLFSLVVVVLAATELAAPAGTAVVFGGAITALVLSRRPAGAGRAGGSGQ
jgi:hypothetical protein